MLTSVLGELLLEAWRQVCQRPGHALGAAVRGLKAAVGNASFAIGNGGRDCGGVGAPCRVVAEAVAMVRPGTLSKAGGAEGMWHHRAHGCACKPEQGIWLWAGTWRKEVPGTCWAPHTVQSLWRPHMSLGSKGVSVSTESEPGGQSLELLQHTTQISTYMWARGNTVQCSELRSVNPPLKPAVEVSKGAFKGGQLTCCIYDTFVSGPSVTRVKGSLIKRVYPPITIRQQLPGVCSRRPSTATMSGVLI